MEKPHNKRKVCVNSHFHSYLSLGQRDSLTGKTWKAHFPMKAWRSFTVSTGNLPKHISARLCLFDGYKCTDHYTSVKHFLLVTFNYSPYSTWESEQERVRERHLKHLFSKSLSLTSSHSHTVILYISLYTHKIQLNTHIQYVCLSSFCYLCQHFTPFILTLQCVFFSQVLILRNSLPPSGL